MQNKITKIGAKVTAAATMLAMFATVSPAMAANATSMKDTLSREAISATSVTHTLTMTLPTGTTTGDFLSTYTGTWANFAFVSGTCTTGTVADNGTATNVLNVTLTGCAAADTLTINFTGDNDGTAGSHTATITGTSTVTGTYAVPLLDSDQVTVTATVDPTITFDIDTNTTGADTAAPYTVALGNLTVGAVNSSDNTTINSIYTQLSTNATSGAVVTVKSATNNGLVSTSVPAEFIPSNTTTMAAGTENYGLCVLSASATTGAYTAAGSYAAPTCVAGGSANTTVALTTTPDPILTTSGAPDTAGISEIVVNAAISATTNAHPDYTDTLTFIATGTF
jgi:hypothetical protein